MKGVNHGEEGSRHITQVYYQHNLGKDNQARPCSAPLPAQGAPDGARALGSGGENVPDLRVLFVFSFFLRQTERHRQISK